MTKRSLYERLLATLAIASSLTILGLSASHTLAAAHSANHKKHLLVVTVTKGFRHDSIPVGEETIKALGDQSGVWETDFVRTDAEMQAKMTRAALKNVDAIVFENTTGVLPLPDPPAFLDFIRNGGGFAAMHAGSDTFHQWPGQKEGEVSEYIQMLGGEFKGHNQQCAVAAKIEDAHFPGSGRLLAAATKMPAPQGQQDARDHTFVSGKTWNVFDEIYLMKNNDRKNVHVLLSLDHHPNDGSKEANQPGEYLLSWSKSYGRGRVFYVAFGHRQEIWRDPLYQQYVEGGLRYVLRLPAR